MTRGPQHPDRTPEGRRIRQDGGNDGRSDKQKGRDYPYYLRLNKEWFDRLQRLLDVPVNRERGTAIPFCQNRADLIVEAFTSFLSVYAVARELNHTRDVEAFVTRLIDGHRHLLGLAPKPPWAYGDTPANNKPPQSPSS